MGFLAMQANGTGSTVAPLPLLQAFQDVNSTMTQANQQVQTPPSYSTPSNAVSWDPAANTNSGAAFVPPSATTGYVPGAQPAGQVAVSPFQQLLFNLLQQFTQQIAAKLAMKLGGSNQLGQNYSAGYSGVPPSSAGTSPYTAANPYANATPTSRSALANTVWIGPADISVSTTTPAMGQSVVVTAQVHDQSSDQDISGLTLELVNPTNPNTASQSMQGGVMVPRSGVTPVQLSWTPDASSTGQVQLLLQAMDSSGQIVTSVSIPRITVLGSGSSATYAGSSNAGAAGNIQITSPTYTSTNQDRSVQNSSTNFTTPVSSAGSTQAPAPTAQLAVTGFGPADPNSPTAGQIPQLMAQVSNPSPIPTQSGQAQLFLDGTPQQMQTIGSLLPSRTLPLQFSAIQTTTGQHNLQLVVTTSDGFSASSNFAANVTAATSANSSGNSFSPSSQAPNGGSGRTTHPVVVRAAAPTIFQIGNIMRATASAPRGIALAGNSGVTVAHAPAAATTHSQSSPPAATAMVSSTTSPRSFVASTTPAPGPAPMSATPPQANPSAQVPAARAILPRVSTATQTPATSSTAQTPRQSSTNAVAPATSANQGVRTLAAPAQPSTVTASPSTTSNQGVRTFTAPAQPSTSTVSPPASTNHGVRTLAAPTQPAASASTTPSAKQGNVKTLTAPPTSNGTPGVKPGAQTSASAARTIGSSSPGTPGHAGGSTAAASGAGGAVRPSTPSVQPGAKPGSAAPGKLDLGISAQDIHLVTASPRAGQVATFTAAIKNAGTLAAQGASVMFLLVANGQQVAASQPMMFNVAPRGIFQARWSVPIPAAANLQVVVTVSANGDANPMNNRAIVPVILASAPVRVPIKPH